MATVAENIESMATLAARIKRDTRLTEGTIVRLIEFNLAYATQNKPNPYDMPDEEFVPPTEANPDEDAVIAAAADVPATTEEE